MGPLRRFPATRPTAAVPSLHSVSGPQLPLTTRPNSSPLSPPLSTPSPRRDTLTSRPPSVSEGAHRLPSRVRALTGAAALSTLVPGAPLASVSSQDAPRKPPLLATRFSGSGGFYTPLSLGTAHSSILLCTGLSDAISPLEQSRVHICLWSYVSRDPQHTAGSVADTR